mmetsp:Transcript_5056/g.8257  ORF Transcript_5056/g.8257 Transcript_5056/m.8257 type:complete len:249 (+) Transcript_5056:58-804(+)
MTSVSWQVNDFSQSMGSWKPNKMQLEGAFGLVFEEPQDKSSETTEVEPEPMPLADREVRLNTELNRSEESMLPAGLLDDITGVTSDLHKEPVNRSIPCSQGLQPVKPVDVSTTVSMLASVLGKNTALHYEADGQRISTTGGNDFVTANFPESRELAPMAPGWQSSGQEIADNAQSFCNYYAAQQYGDIPYQGTMYSKLNGFPGGSWSANAAGGANAPSMRGRFCVFCGKPKHSQNQRFCSHCGNAVVA